MFVLVRMQVIADPDVAVHLHVKGAMPCAGKNQGGKGIQKHCGICKAMGLDGRGHRRPKCPWRDSSGMDKAFSPAKGPKAKAKNATSKAQAQKDAKNATSTAQKDAKAGGAKASTKRSRATSQDECLSTAGSNDEGGAKRAKTTRRRQQDGEGTTTLPPSSPRDPLASKQLLRDAVREKQEALAEIRRLNKQLSRVPEEVSEEVSDDWAASSQAPAKRKWDSAQLEAARTARTLRPILCAAHPLAIACKTMC